MFNFKPGDPVYAIDTNLGQDFLKSSKIYIVDKIYPPRHECADTITLKGNKVHWIAKRFIPANLSSLEKLVWDCI